MVKISDRVSKILPSGTLAMTQKAQELKVIGRVCFKITRRGWGYNGIWRELRMQWFPETQLCK